MTEINFKLDAHQLVELYSISADEYSDDISFSLGYIMKNFDDYLLFQSISEYGTLDSFQFRRKDGISDIKTDTDYTKMFDFFVDYNKRNETFDTFHLSSEYEFYKDSSLGEILDYNMQNEKIVSIITDEDDEIITGKIILLDDRKLVVSEVSLEDMSQQEKVSIFKKSIITMDLISIENILLGKYLESK